MAMYLNAPPTGATGTSGDDEFIFRSQAVFQLAGAVNGRGGFDRLVFDGNVSLNDLAFGRVFNMESLVLNGTGTQKLTFGHSAGAAFAQGVVDVDASKAGALTLNAGGIGPGARVVVTGSAGDDAITGGAGDDVIDGGAGNDVIKGGLGNDVLRGAAGDDVIHGGAGDDRIEGGDGNDTLRGEAGDDTLVGGAGDDALYGGAGDDVLEGGDGNDLLRGDAGNDVLRGGAGDDTLSGMDGEDVLEGGAGNDILMGGAGADRLDGGAGDDRLSGGDGDDSLCGDEGDDVLDGDAGNDLLWGGDGDDRLYGGDGNDMLTGGFGADKLYGEAGNDVLLSRSDAGEPKIMQRTTAKAVHAADALLEADDRLTGGAGADTFRFELLMDAKREVAARHVNADGTIDWAGVARENGSPHDHWVNGIGIDRIMDFNRAEGDRIEIFGHTVKATLRLMDSDGDGVKDYSEILLTSDQGANGGAHHGDKLGTIKVFGDLLTERDVTVNAAVHYGAFATLDDPRDTECCGVMPGGIMGSDHLMG